MSPGGKYALYVFYMYVVSKGVIYALHSVKWTTNVLYGLYSTLAAPGTSLANKRLRRCTRAVSCRWLGADVVLGEDRLARELADAAEVLLDVPPACTAILYDSLSTG